MLDRRHPDITAVEAHQLTVSAEHALLHAIPVEAAETPRPDVERHECARDIAVH
jgi:hypothetical protein